MTLDEILEIGFRGGASDIHLKVGLPPMFRIDGKLVALRAAERLTPELLKRFVDSLLDERQRGILTQKREVDLAHGISGIGRFRVNVFFQRGSLGMAIRVIPQHVPTFAELRLPPVLRKIAELQRGLVLVTGTTSSGKSSTLAAIISHINQNRAAHILTLEDPIEFLIRDSRAMINQREIGMDALSFAESLRSAMRQDPDVILIGELRDLETVGTAIAAAETGHLVLSTLHTLDAAETIARLVSFFPPYQHTAIRAQLSSVLRAVVSQRLVPCANGSGRVPAVEVMINTSRMAELIADETLSREMRDLIAQGYKSYGMQTFDQSLMQLVKHELITYDEACRQATNPADFALRFKGISSTSDGNWDDFEEEAPSAAVEEPAENGGLEIERFDNPHK